MELDVCINGRRSIRSYEDAPVSREQLTALLKAAQMAPSWKNSQVSRYYVVETAENREKFMDCLPAFNQNSSKNAGAFIVTTVAHGLSGCGPDGAYSTHLKGGFECFDNGLQVENLCLKAYELGLGTLIMGIYDEKKIRDFLNVPKEEEIVAVIAVGRPAVSPEAKPRKEIEEIAKFF